MDLYDGIFQELLDSLHDGVYFVDPNRNILFWNKGAERMTGYTKEDAEGDCCPGLLLTHVDGKGDALCTGDCPLMQVLRTGESREAEVFFRHKKGHRVPVLVRITPMFSETGAVKGAVEVFTDMTRHHEDRKRLEDLAMLCPLTGIGNRRFTAITLDNHIEELDRYGWPFAVLFIDIDRFKEINDQYGHDKGDEVLVMAANTLGNSLRGFDYLGRWGGEEFVAILSNVSRTQAHEVAERCRVLMENSFMKHDESLIRVTISIGVALARNGEAACDILARADQLMYQSKSDGRNRVTMDEPPVSAS